MSENNTYERVWSSLGAHTPRRCMRLFAGEWLRKYGEQRAAHVGAARESGSHGVEFPYQS